MIDDALLPVAHPTDLAARDPAARWLVRELWAREAVGIVGGAPKCAKSWLGLEMAVSVATGTPCLGRFPVDDPGPALVYLAEDALPDVRTRIEALVTHRGRPLDALDLHVITAPALRLDLERDRARLVRTLERHRPKILLLDPLVRLHRLDENSAAEISGLLGELREIERRFALAIVVVHHANKKSRPHPGQTLRGSGDLWAWGDSNAYLTRSQDALVLTLEHRSAPAPSPLRLKLRSRPDGTATHLEVLDGHATRDAERETTDLERAIVAMLGAAGTALHRNTIRTRLRVQNQRLGEALASLERQGVLTHAANGWTRAAIAPAPI